jgi:hypothetical protein
MFPYFHSFFFFFAFSIKNNKRDYLCSRLLLGSLFLLFALFLVEILFAVKISFVSFILTFFKIKCQALAIWILKMIYFTSYCFLHATFYKKKILKKKYVDRN